MIVCITEKPNVARDIAAILGAGKKEAGYYEGNGYRVTWTYGHLCTLKEPNDYCDAWKRWSLVHLPMIPPKFGIKLIPIENYERQFAVIKKLFAEADEIINCGDAGQEGELIQRWVMQKAGVKCPVKRLWISSLTDQSIREGFSNLRPSADFDNLYYAGLSRAIGDWILGMNATRLYSLKYSAPGNVLSIGRVQTPTLALVVQRQLEIDNFKPEDYWELKTLCKGATFNAVSGRFKNEAEAQAALEAIKPSLLTVTSVDEKKGREAPPRLFDLTSLQVECNRQWGWTADETLRLIQTLYEKKVTTYPRVDTTYLTDDIYPTVGGILKAMTPYAPLTAPILSLAKIPKSKKIFDNSKVTDHHAIIPTGQLPTTLVGDEKLLYHLIARRFIAAFYPDCEFMQTTVLAEAGGVGFKASGKVVTSPGWRVIYQKNSDRTADQNGQTQGEGGDDSILPPFAVGESNPHEPSLLKKATQPPKYYTEGTLLRAMESAGKTVDDEVLREAMKENGIGRPSTRANIIETLFKRRYIYRKKKNIIASPAGIQLIATINEELLKSAKLTGIWENRLRRIERGEYSPAEFIDNLKVQINTIVTDVLTDANARRIDPGATPGGAPLPDKKPVNPDGNAPAASAAPKPKTPRKAAVRKLEQIVCPICGKGHLLKGHTAYGCSEYKNGCTLRLPFDAYPADLTPGKLNTLIKKNHPQR
ncbi:MAG: DNA topoisomerase 3 [Muribaculaceae bacterium]|nr:DNA topoisomerase 3 [Muribaculaceae bacterium]